MTWQPELLTPVSKRFSLSSWSELECAQIPRAALWTAPRPWLSCPHEPQPLSLPEPLCTPRLSRGLCPAGTYLQAESGRAPAGLQSRLPFLGVAPYVARGAVWKRLFTHFVSRLSARGQVPAASPVRVKAGVTWAIPEPREPRRWA